VPNSYSLVQAVLGPVIAKISDTFQARKFILVGTCMVSFIGAAIAPGANSIGRLIAAQTMIGFGFAAVPLGYCVPSEIVPKRWRPMIQALMNVGALLGSISGPIAIGALTRQSVHSGWKNFFWIQFAIWGLTTIGLFVGYRPRKRHTHLDRLSFWQKLRHIDLLGNGLLIAGLTLLLVGLNLGGELYTWTNTKTLATLVVGIATLAAFGVWEWKGTESGILHHDLFRRGKNSGRTYGILIMLMFIEGVMLFSFIIFYPVVYVLYSLSCLVLPLLEMSSLGI
jgi:MFS family permease